MIENIFLAISILLAVLFLGMFSVLLNNPRLLAKNYISRKERIVAGLQSQENIKEQFSDKLANWYFSRQALPFWNIFLMDCLVIIYSHLMGAYLVNGGQELVPRFWDYILFACCSIPLYYIGMRLFHTYESVTRFSTIEDLMRVACSMTMGLLLTDLVKNLLPHAWSPVWPQWREQVAFLICAVILMWCIRCLSKKLFDTSDHSKDKTFIFGTGLASIELGLALRREQPIRNNVIGFIRTHDKAPNCCLKDSDIYSMHDDIAEEMSNVEANTLLVPFSEFETFRNINGLLPELIKKGISVKIIP